MPKYVNIAAHLSVEELAHRSRKATHVIERASLSAHLAAGSWQARQRGSRDHWLLYQLDQDSRAALQSAGANSPC